MNIYPSQLVRMKTAHTCGSRDNYIFRIFRVGMDVGLQCVKCSKRVRIPRARMIDSAVSIASKNVEKLRMRIETFGLSFAFCMWFLMIAY